MFGVYGKRLVVCFFVIRMFIFWACRIHSSNEVREALEETIKGEFGHYNFIITDPLFGDQ